jgi:hypothetical protein
MKFVGLIYIIKDSKTITRHIRVSLNSPYSVCGIYKPITVSALEEMSFHGRKIKDCKSCLSNVVTCAC